MLTISESRSETDVRSNEIGSDLVLLSWLGAGVSRRGRDPEDAYRAIARALRERGCVPVQERVFCDLSVASSVAAARERALSAADESWPVPATFVEGAPLEGRGVAGVHVLGVRGLSLIHI